MDILDIRKLDRTSTLTAMDNGHTRYKEVWFRTSTLPTMDILDIRRPELGRLL